MKSYRFLNAQHRSLSTLIVATILILGASETFVQAQEQNAGKGAKDAKKVDPSGTWRLEYDWQGTPVKDAFRLQLLDGGKVVGTLFRNDSKLDILRGKFKGNKLEFATVLEFDGVEWTTEFSGTIKGDSLEGKAILKGDGQSFTFDWKPKRSVLLEDVSGKWNLAIQMGDETRKATLTIDPKSKKHTYVSQSGTKAKPNNLKVKNNQLTFDLEVDFQGAPLKLAYRARAYGNSLAGAIDYEYGDSTGSVELTGTRDLAKKAKGKKTTSKESKSSDKKKK